MKKVGLILLVLLFVVPSATQAQKFKYGHVNGEAVLRKMPEIQLADTTLKTLVKELEDQVKKMNDEYTAKVTEYKAKEATMSDLIKKTQADQINDLNKKMQQFQIDAQETINQKRVELYTPAIEKFNNALKSVAKKNGYSFIIDNSKGVLLYYDEKDDVTNLIEKELGIK